MFFSKEDKILMKNLRQLKGYTATRFLREFRTKNRTRAWTRSWLLGTKTFSPVSTHREYVAVIILL